MSTEIYFAYLLATIVIVIVPGPTVTLIVANSLTHGTRAGLLNVAGTQAGLAVCIAIVAVGLASLVQSIGWWFDWLRIVGAAYLIWIGWKLIRSTGEIDMSKVYSPDGASRSTPMLSGRFHLPPQVAPG